jgi:chromosomal replication initiator protein
VDRGSQVLADTPFFEASNEHLRYLSWKKMDEGLDPTAGAPPDRMWAAAMSRFEGNTSRAVMDAWYRPIEVVGGDERSVLLGVPDEQTRAFLASNHLDAIRDTLRQIYQRPVDVDLRITSPQPLAIARLPANPHVQLSIAAIEPISSTPAPAWSDGLIQMLNFDAFVAGRSNQLAHGASRVVAESPGTTYNPLFIHGGVGVGKTHLLHAVGLHAKHQHPGFRVLYVHAAAFIDDVIAAMRNKSSNAMSDIRRRYRDVDLLLVDDIQFLRSTPKTAEEFFHTFNALHQAARQIVITSDRNPAELAGFSDRLASRFSWGLVAEIAPPDHEMRIAVLLRKARDYGFGLPMDVVHYLADHLQNNVRELEGALKKLMAHSRIGGRKIDLAMARDVLGPVLESPSARLTIDAIQRTVAAHYQLRITDLKGSKRHRAVVVPRMLAMHLCRIHAGSSFPEIGRAFGGRDHTTAINAHRRIQKLLKGDEFLRHAAQAVTVKLGR